MDNQIHLVEGENYRIYLGNMLDFDLRNSFDLYGMLFNYITGGTTTTPDYKKYMVTQTIGDRGILEFTGGYPARYTFHANKTEFTEKG